MTRRLLLLGLLLTAPALTACGRQGPLRLPKPAAEPTAAPEPDAEDKPS